MTKLLKTETTVVRAEEGIIIEEEEGDLQRYDLPTMIVFDLDDCLWTPEMHELYEMPSIPIQGNLNPDHETKASSSSRKQPRRTAKRKLNASNSKANLRADDTTEIGTVGMRVPGTSQIVYLYDGARRALREIALDEKYSNVLIAVASSSLEPTYSHQCLNHIEIIPGVTMRDIFDFDEIGRTGHLTSRKTTHFESLHRRSHVPYEEMLFFDDCNWADHVQDVGESFGVVGVRTPNGLQIDEFHAGLDKFRKSIQE